MKRCIAIVGAALLCAGCTTASLERSTVTQASSVSDMRYQQVLDNLARLEVEPCSLPTFSILANGASVFSDTMGIESATLLDQGVHGFSKETLTPSVKRNPDPNWTLNPVVAGPLLDAMHYAYVWVLFGPPARSSPAYSLLDRRRGPSDYDLHLDVARDLATLPPTSTWLHMTSRSGIPKNACYKGCYGDTYVSVTPDGMAALSAFTLVVLDIATTDPTSLNPQLATATVEREISINTFGQDRSIQGPGPCKFCQPPQQPVQSQSPPGCACIPQAQYCPCDLGGLPIATMASQSPLEPDSTQEGCYRILPATTVITENWYAAQELNGAILVYYPLGWCDNKVVRIVPTTP